MPKQIRVTAQQRQPLDVARLARTLIAQVRAQTQTSATAKKPKERHER